MTARADTTALTAAVERGEVRDFRRREKSKRLWFDTTNAWVIVIVVVAALLVSPRLIDIARSSTDGRDPNESLTVVLAFAGIAVLLIVLVRLRGRAAWAARLRRSRFADANGMVYDEPADAVDYPGAVFSAGDSQSRDVRFRTREGPYAEFGTYRWTVGGGRTKRSYRIGFAAMRFERPLPHMVLHPRDNDGFSGIGIIPFRVDRDQVLSLGGDVDRSFTLYGPSDDERIAREVFTPDVLALLVDGPRRFDVEIVDDWVFVYSTRAFDVDEPATWQRLFRIRDTIVATLHRASSVRRDDGRPGQDVPVLAPVPVPDSAAAGPTPVVAAPCRRRMRSRVQVVVIVAAAVVTVAWIVFELFA